MNWRAPRRLRFTRDGKILTGMCLAVGFAAVNTGNNLLYLILGWALAFIIASGLLSEATLRGVIAAPQQRGPLFAGEPGALDLLLTNSKAKRASYSVVATCGSAAAYFLRLGAGESQRASIQYTFASRGRQAIQEIQLSTKYPFGLFDKSLTLGTNETVVVYPRRVNVSLDGLASAVWGETPLPRLGRSGDFFGLRPFRVGDDVRDIHWRSTARHGQLVVREMEDAMQRATSIIVDNSDGYQLEEVIVVAASVARELLRQGWAVGLITCDGIIPPERNATTEATLLTRLALLAHAPQARPLEARVGAVFLTPDRLPQWRAHVEDVARAV